MQAEVVELPTPYRPAPHGPVHDADVLPPEPYVPAQGYIGDNGTGSRCHSVRAHGTCASRVGPSWGFLLFPRGSPGEHGPVQEEEACPDDEPYLPLKQDAQVPATPKVPAEHGWCTTHFVQDENPPKKNTQLEGVKRQIQRRKKKHARDACTVATPAGQVFPVHTA